MTAPLTDLTVSIIAKDASRTIQRTLEAVSGLADRIIVVDSGSTDNTIDLCTRHGAEVVHQEWLGYGRQKQMALELCESAWVLCLDADEEPDAVLGRQIEQVLGAPDDAIHGYELNRRVWMGDHELKHVWHPEWRLRLVRRASARWIGLYHERLEVSDGGVRRLRGNLLHHAFADTSDLIRKQIMHGLKAAEVFYAQGARSSVPRLLISPGSAIVKQLLLRGGFLDGWPGWMASLACGMYAATKHMRLVEMGKERSDEVTE